MEWDPAVSAMYGINMRHISNEWIIRLQHSYPGYRALILQRQVLMQCLATTLIDSGMPRLSVQSEDIIRFQW